MTDTIHDYQSKGIQFVIGRLKGETSTTVQSVLFDKTVWNSSAAKKWLGDNNFKSSKLDETEAKLRFRQRDPGDFKDGSFRTIAAGSRSQVQTFGEHGVKLRVGRLKGDDLLSIQAILFSKAAWSLLDAVQWLHDRHFFGGSRFDDSGDFWTFQINSPESFDDSGMKEISEHETSFTEFIEEYAAHRKKKKKEFDGNINGIEIFRTGVWNKDKYTTEDLDAIVDSFGKVGFPVPVKLGHAEKSGGPAFGWVKALRRVGDLLVADFMDIPEKLFDLIKNRRFDTVSSEIFWNLERNGKKFRRVLKAVALLGAETPGVSDLAPLRSVVSTTPDTGFDRVLTYSVRPEEWNMDKIDELTAKVSELETKLTEATKAKDDAEAKLAEASKGKDSDEAKVKLTEAEETIEKLTEDLGTAKKSLEEEAKGNAAKVKDLSSEVRRLTEKVAKQEEDNRQELISKSVEGCQLTVIREHVKALYDFVTSVSTEKVVKFKQDDKEEEVSAQHVLDQLIAELNKYAAKLFKEFGKVDAGDRPEGVDYTDVSLEVKERVDEYMTKNDLEVTTKNLERATEAVFKKDPELKRAYAATSSN